MAASSSAIDSVPGLRALAALQEHEADDQHQADDRGHGETLAVMQVGKADAVLRHGAGEYFLNDGEDDGRGNQQAKDRNRGGDPGQRKDAAEDEEFADESVETRQAKR